MDSSNFSTDIGDSNPVDLAEAAMATGNWAQAFELLNSPGLTGDPAAQNLLAWLYLGGKGISRDPHKAILCLQRSVEKDYWPAICNLARAYQYGIGIKKNPFTAFELYKRAADEDAQGRENFCSSEQSKAIIPNNSYLDECWSYCQQWVSHIRRRQMADIRLDPNLSKPKRIRRLAAIKLKYLKDAILNNPMGFIQWVLFALCQATLTAIIISIILPSISGFSFWGTTYDALLLGLVFYAVNLVICISTFIAIPIYLLCFVFLIYFGCDLPVIGLILLPFATAITKLFLKLGQKQMPTQSPIRSIYTNEEQFMPRSLKHDKEIQRRMYWFSISLILIAMVVTVRIVADCFPNIFIVQGWTTTFIIVMVLAVSNQLLIKLTRLVSRTYNNEWALMAQWIFEG